MGKKMSTPKTTLKSAVERIQLAQTYFEDGAPFSAARCLREAADIFEAIGEKRNRELEALQSATVAKASA